MLTQPHCERHVGWVFACLAGLATCGAQQSPEIDLLITGHATGRPDQESADSIYNRLANAISVDEAGRSVDGFDTLRGISPDGMIAEDVAPDPDAIGVDMSTDTGMRTVAGGNFEVTAGGAFTGKIVEQASLTTGGVDLTSVKGVSVMSGEDVELSASGDVYTDAVGDVSLEAMSGTARLGGTAGLVAGGDVGLTAGGGAYMDSDSLLAAVRGDIDASGRAVHLSGTEELSIHAGEVDVQTPGAVRLRGKGATAEMSEGETEFVTYVWRSTSDFNLFDNVLPEVIPDVSELLIRASFDGSPAQIVGDAHAVDLLLGEEAGADLEWTMVWTATARPETYSMDGLVVQLENPLDVAAVRLNSIGGSSRTFQGWSIVEFMFGRRTPGGLRVASESNLNVAAAKDAMLSAESVQLSSASLLDIGAESTHLTSNEISVKSASGLDAAAESLQLEVSVRLLLPVTILICFSLKSCGSCRRKSMSGAAGTSRDLSEQPPPTSGGMRC